MSTHPYKHRSKPSKRSIRLSTLASMVGYKKHSGEWYDAPENTRVMLDEAPMWEVGNAGPEFIKQWDGIMNDLYEQNQK